MIILTWNRDFENVWPLKQYEAERNRCLTGKSISGNWSVGKHRNVPIGSEVYFLVQGNKHVRGLVARGYTTSAPEEGRHWADRKKTSNYVNLKISSMLSLDDTIPVQLLESMIPEVKWRNIYQSGLPVKKDGQSKLKAVWDNFSVEQEIPQPGEINSGQYVEGGFRTIKVNRYERDPAARRASLAHHGKLCFVCEIDLEKVYGSDLGETAIHVHHVKPMSTRRKTPYIINPIKDLIPLCPNCHNVIHKVDPVLSPEDLRRIYKSKQTKN